MLRRKIFLLECHFFDYNNRDFHQKIKIEKLIKDIIRIYLFFYDKTKLSSLSLPTVVFLECPTVKSSIRIPNIYVIVE